MPERAAKRVRPPALWRSYGPGTDRISMIQPRKDEGPILYHFEVSQVAPSDRKQAKGLLGEGWQGGEW